MITSCVKTAGKVAGCQLLATNAKEPPTVDNPGSDGAVSAPLPRIVTIPPVLASTGREKLGRVAVPEI